MPGAAHRDARTFGHACLQNGRIYGPGANNTYDATIASTLNTPVGNEDCLTLNIWRPAHETPKLPVIAFVYGGSNVSGYTADPVYDGATLARTANAVVVTLNYRVGVLGFMNLPQLKTGTNTSEDSGNFALLDILQALKFVQTDIAAFGGDAANVTLMGQSAGAINIWALMTSPLSTGLFHKAVPISGGISLASNLPAGTLPTLNPASTYLAQGNALLLNLLVADGKATDTTGAQAYLATQTAAQVADYLRAKDAKTILTTLLAKGLTGSGPIPDGVVVPTDPIAAIAAGRYTKVPVLAGNTADEGKLFAPFLTLLGGKPGMKIGDAERFADAKPPVAHFVAHRARRTPPSRR
jgi:para-nitrobenzyl esterase